MNLISHERENLREEKTTYDDLSTANDVNYRSTLKCHGGTRTGSLHDEFERIQTINVLFMLVFGSHRMQREDDDERGEN